MADMDTTIWLSPSSATKAANDHLKFHCGCPISEDVAQADFAYAVLLATVQRGEAGREARRAAGTGG